MSNNAAYWRIISELKALGIEDQLVSIAGDIVDIFEQCGVKPDAMNLELFGKLAGDEKLTEITQTHLARLEPNGVSE